MEEGVRQGVAQGVRLGVEQGVRQGVEQGVKQMLRLQLEKRFGRLPASVLKRLDLLSDAQAQELVLAVIDAKSLKELFGSSVPASE